MSDEFEEQVQKYHRLVMNLCRRYYGGRLRENAEDLSQEIWIKLWENFKKNEHNIVNFKSYLYRTVQTTAWDAVRRLEKESQQDVPGEDLPAEQGEEDRTHARIALDDLLTKLKPEEARMIRAHLKGFNHSEIAHLMGCSEGRVRNLLTRIRKKMAQWGGI